ncbi:hypothetical protein EV182_005107 [Spiromyces aspiralis]|uniref:Uncharacterized protein n=1 Tax=Spiromyces aspiralis TaxID=68401 RepID=A0ACC1HNC4_9FUNG|nr:hypothetical protein EV182_005107 [Spiromyces aspiralis]
MLRKGFRLLSQSRRHLSVAATNCQRSTISAGVLLQRDPVVTPPVDAFQKEYDAYMDWLKYQTADPFPTEFYLKKGSTLEAQWKERENERRSVWYFEDKADRPKHKVKTSNSENEAIAGDAGREGLGAKIKLNPRETEADRKGDLRSLERKLERTLYLIVKDASQKWRLVEGELKENEVLRGAAERKLSESMGTNMDIWFVGNGPIGVHTSPKNKASVKMGRARVFYMKAHIFSGQVRPQSKDTTDFAWVTKDEMEKIVEPEYWTDIKDMLSSQ